MGENGCTRNNTKTYQRLPHTFLPKTSTCFSEHSKRPISHPCLRRNVSNYTQDEIARDFRSCTDITKFHFPSISCAETRWNIPSHIQPQSAKRPCENGTVSLNKHAPHTGFPATTRLDVQNRLVTSVLPSTCNQISQVFPSPHIQSRAARNDMPALRLEHCPKNVFHSDELGSTTVARKMEYENSSLSRRFLNCKSRCGHSSQPCENHGTDITKPRVVSKLREICLTTSTMHNLLGNSLETLAQPKIITTRKNHNVDQNITGSSNKEEVDFERISKNRRSAKLCQLCSTKRSAKSSKIIKIHKFVTEPFNKTVSNVSRRNEGNILVDSELSSVHTSPLPTSRKFSNNRCFRCSLGRAAKQSDYLRKLVNRGTSPALQPQGNASYLTCTTETSSRNSAQLNFDTMRQPNCSCLSPERRRNKVTAASGNNTSNFEPNGSTSNSFQHPPYTGQVQQPCRSLVATSPAPRMAPTSSMCGNSVCEMGHSDNRPICIGNSTRSIQLCVSRPEGQGSPISRRLQCAVELQPGVDIPPTISNSQGANSPQSGDRHIPSCSSSVGEGILARGLEIASPSGSTHPETFTEPSGRHVNGTPASECQVDHPRGVEMWGWTEAIDTWSTNQISLLRNSWRKSTLKTYEVAWKRWTLWCGKNNVNFKSPTGSQLARFLSDLYLVENLSYSTILLHKSVVSTLCDVETSSRLSSHVLVKHILKSIALKKPRMSKPPIWDISKLALFLTNYTIDSNSIFQCSRHTAILLLLCSGRRLHDLTLLRIDTQHCIRSDNSIIFWPQFGSKTDNSNYRQSGWKLLRNENNYNLDPVQWIDKTITLLNERRKAANTHNLFVTIKGTPKQASRTVIGGWVKTLFKEAGIADSPGSIRSAVASKSWAQNHSMDDILARGNWRSANTFKRFYRRELRQGTANTNNTDNVTNFFNPLD